MKRYLYEIIVVTFCFIILFGFNSSSKSEYVGDISKIKLIYVNPYITTISSVKCNEFNKVFSKVLKEKIFTEKDEIQRVQSLINSAEVKNDTLKSLDTRFKIYFYNQQSEVTSVICGNLFGVNINENYYFLDEKDSVYLRELLDVKE